MPWFCIHEPVPSENESQTSGITRSGSIASEGNESNQQS